MLLRLIALLLVLLLNGYSHFGYAHKYFFSLTEINLNTHTHHLEIIHQLTAHDLETAIAEQKQEHFSPEHPQYEHYIRQYIESHFSLNYQQQTLSLSWVGIETIRGNILIYQEVPFQNFLAGIVVKNDLLVDTYSEQVNTVNYQSPKQMGSLTFTKLQKVAKIIDKK